MNKHLNNYIKKHNKNIFMIYSYISTIGVAFLDLFPHFVRNLFYKALLGKMGKGVLIDYKVYLRYLKNIELGDNVSINRGCQFYTSVNLGRKIIIGNNVVISPNAKFYGAAHDHKRDGMPDIAEDIIVHDNCWICADTTILLGVTIGQGSVIGAGSVVTKDVPPNSIAVGNPARVIGSRALKNQ